MGVKYRQRSEEELLSYGDVLAGKCFGALTQDCFCQVVVHTCTRIRMVLFLPAVCSGLRRQTEYTGMVTAGAQFFFE